MVLRKSCVGGKDQLISIHQNQIQETVEGDRGALLSSHGGLRPKRSPDEQGDVLEKRAVCCKGCLFLRFPHARQRAHTGCRGQACPEVTRGSELNDPRLPLGMTAGNYGHGLVQRGPASGGTGQCPRTSVAGVSGDGPGIKQVEARDTAQPSMMPEKALKGSTEEGPGPVSQLSAKPRISPRGQVWRVGPPES